MADSFTPFKPKNRGNHSLDVLLIKWMKDEVTQQLGFGFTTTIEGDGGSEATATTEGTRPTRFRATISKFMRSGITGAQFTAATLELLARAVEIEAPKLRINKTLRA